MAGFKVVGSFCHLLFSVNPKCWTDRVAKKQELKAVKEAAQEENLLVLTTTSGGSLPWAVGKDLHQVWAPQGSRRGNSTPRMV